MSNLRNIPSNMITSIDASYNDEGIASVDNHQVGLKELWVRWKMSRDDLEFFTYNFHFYGFY